MKKFEKSMNQIWKGMNKYDQQKHTHTHTCFFVLNSHMHYISISERSDSDPFIQQMIDAKFSMGISDWPSGFNKWSETRCRKRIPRKTDHTANFFFVLCSRRCIRSSCLILRHSPKPGLKIKVWWRHAKVQKHNTLWLTSAEPQSSVWTTENRVESCLTRS